MPRHYGHKQPPKRVLVTRHVEQYSRALRQAAGLARLDGATVVVWQHGEGEFRTYDVAGEGVTVPGATPLVKVVPV